MKFSVWTLLLFFGVFVGAQRPGVDEIAEAEALMQRGIKQTYTDKEAAYSHLEDAYKLFKKHKAWLQCIKAVQEISSVSYVHFDLSEYGRSLHRVDSIFNARTIFLDSIKEIQSIKNAHLLFKASYYKEINDYPRSLEYSQQIIFNITNIPDSLWTVQDIKSIYVGYEFRAGVYLEQGKYDLARDLYENCLRLGAEGQFETNFTAPTLDLLGGLLNKQKKYSESNEYYLQYLNSILEAKTDTDARALTSYFVIAQNHIRLHQKDSAAFYLSRAKQQLSKNDPFAHRYYQIQGELLQSIGSYKEALMSMDTAITLLSANSITENNFELARLYERKAIMYNDQSEFVPALANLQTAIEQITTNFSADSKSWPNPELKDVLNKEELVKILKYKAYALNMQNEYVAAMETVDLGVKALDVLKPNFKSEADKLFLIEDAFPLFESGLAAAYALYTESKNEKYIDRAFHYSEKSKAAILLEALLNAQATEFANVPEQLLEKERQLKSQIAHIEKQRDTHQETSEASEDKLFTLKNEYRNLVRSIETKYPSYYDLKYDTGIVSTDQLQELLASDELLLSYFYGNDAIYAIAIDENDKQIERISVDSSLETQITKIYGPLTDPQSDVEALGGFSLLLVGFMLFGKMKSRKN